ncbi:MAG: DUF4149 domain-containing protein [bacterium]
MILIIFLYVYSICLSVFFGSSIFIGYFTAPYIFKTIKSRDEAGNIVGSLLHKFSILGFITQPVMIILGYMLYINKYSNIFIMLVPFIILILIIFSENFISKRMNNLKKQMISITVTPKEDARRKEFNYLHKWSVKLFLANEILCLPLFYIIFIR